MQTKDGQFKSGLLSAAIVEVDGARHIVAICKDITDRLEAETKVEAARRDLQSVLDAASEISIIATNKEGLVTIFNRGAEKMLGYRAYESVGQLHAADFHDADELEQRSRELSQKFGCEISGIDIFQPLPLCMAWRHATGFTLPSTVKNSCISERDGADQCRSGNYRLPWYCPRHHAAD
jgi:PAS domain-containing protein